jgi:hypothetical protein
VWDAAVALCFAFSEGLAARTGTAHEPRWDLFKKVKRLHGMSQMRKAIAGGLEARKKLDEVESIATCMTKAVA